MPKPINNFNDFKKLSRDERGYFIYDAISDNTKHLMRINGTVAKHEKFIWILSGVGIALSIMFGQDIVPTVLAKFM